MNITRYLLGLIALSFALAAACGEQTSTSVPGDAATASETEAPSPNRAALAKGASAVAEDLRITVQDIADPYKSSNQFSEPAKGKHFVAFKVLVENVGEDQQNVSPFDFTLLDDTGFQYDPGFIVFEEAELSSADLAGGAKTSGWFGFEVNDGAAPAKLTYDPNPFTDDDIEFSAGGNSSPTSTPASTRCVPWTDADRAALIDGLKPTAANDLVGMMKVQSGDYDARGFYAARLGPSGDVAVWSGGWPDLSADLVVSVNEPAHAASVWPFGPDTESKITLEKDGAKEVAACLPARQ